MIVEQTKDYEFEERAAVREYDGRYPKAKAEQLAAADMLERKREAKRLEQKSQENSIESLREKRDQIGKKMRAEKEGARKDELFAEWMELSGQIITLRKELEK